MAVLRSDDFDRPDASPSNSPSDGLSDYVIGNVSVLDGLGSCYESFGYVFPAALEAATADVEVSLKIINTWDYAQPCGVAVRVTSSEFIALAAENFGSSLKIVQYASYSSAGSGVVLADCGTYTSGDILTLRAVGDVISAFKNGLLVGTATGVTTNQSVTAHGFFCSSLRGRNDIDDLLIVGVSPPSLTLITDWW